MQRPEDMGVWFLGRPEPVHCSYNKEYKTEQHVEKWVFSLDTKGGTKS